MAAGLGINPPKRELLDKPVSGFGQGVKKLQKACLDDSHALRGPGLFTAGPLPSPPGTTGGSFNQNRSCQFVNSIAVSPPTQWLKPHLELYQTMIQRGFGAPLSRIKPLFGRSDPGHILGGRRQAGHQPARRRSRRIESAQPRPRQAQRGRSDDCQQQRLPELAQFLAPAGGHCAHGMELWPPRTWKGIFSAPSAQMHLTRREGETDKKFELRQKRLRSSIVPDFKLSSATSGCYSLRKSTGRGSYVSNTKH